MSGVITNGVQYEHCCHCGDFVPLDELNYGHSTKWPDHNAVDLCDDCFESNRKHYIHRFTVVSNWRWVLWSDALSADASLTQYSKLTADLMANAKYT